MASLDTQGHQPAPPLGAMFWIRAVLNPALALALIAGVWFWKSQPKQLVSQTAAPPVTLPLERLIQQPNPGQILAAWSEKLDQPLESEMQLVVSDAKTALHSLSANFLPEH